MFSESQRLIARKHQFLFMPQRMHICCLLTCLWQVVLFVRMFHVQEIERPPVRDTVHSTN